VQNSKVYIYDIAYYKIEIPTQEVGAMACKLYVKFTNGQTLVFDNDSYSWHWDEDRTLVVEKNESGDYIVIPYDNVLYFEVKSSK